MSIVPVVPRPATKREMTTHLRSPMHGWPKDCTGPKVTFRYMKLVHRALHKPRYRPDHTHS